MTPAIHAPVEDELQPDQARLPKGLLELLAGTAFLLGIGWRLIDWHRVFWLDEVFTAAIAYQPSFHVLVLDCARELSGPVYYGFAWAWVKIAGASNTALRLPSLLFSVGAALLLLWRGHPDRQVRLVWGALASLSFIAVYYSIEARSYSLLFLLGTLQAILFGRIARRPTIRGALGWCLVSALLVLTHYFSLPLVGLQGLFYLRLQGRRALRTWPAALVFVPVVAWMCVQIPILLSFSDPRVAWQTLVGIRTVVELATLIFGVPFALVLVLVLVPLATIARDLFGHTRGDLCRRFAPADLAILAASVGTVVTILVFGRLTPSFSPRYLMPTIPGLLLAPAAWSVVWARRMPLLPAVTIGVFLIAGAVHLADRATHEEQGTRTAFAWENAADVFMANHVRHLVFFWDEAQTVLARPTLLERAGGFFFYRAHAGVTVTPVILAGKVPVPDPNRVLPAEIVSPAAPAGRGAFLWIYNTEAGDRSVANRYPPRLAELGRRFDCRQYQTEWIKVLGCIQRNSELGKTFPASIGP